MEEKETGPFHEPRPEFREDIRLGRWSRTRYLGIRAALPKR